jgi:hypothetical protein
MQVTDKGAPANKKKLEMSQFFTLSEREATATQLALDVLRSVPWATQLVARVVEGGGLSTANMPFLFEARFGLALHDCGIAPEYEYAAGVGETTVDFQFGPWLVELYSLDESDALKAATWEMGSSFGRVLLTAPPFCPGGAERTERKLQRDLALLDAGAESDAVKEVIRREVQAEHLKTQEHQKELFKQSPGAEIVKAIERVVGKASRDGQPAKFPEPDGSRYSMLVVDARAVGAAGPDRHDCRLIAYGANAVSEWIDHHMVDAKGRAHPIRGAFDAGAKMRDAQNFRERVHFLGIVAEETYDRDELQYSIRFYHNPHLFRSCEEARAALETFPLFQPGKVRERRPDLFVDEVTKQASADEIEFGIVMDGKVLPCRVHRDTLEDLEKRGIDRGSSDMIQTFERHKATLRSLAEEKYRRGEVNNNGISALLPADLRLRPQVLGGQ